MGFRIIVLAHKRGKLTDLCKLYQVAKCVINFRSKVLSSQFLADFRYYVLDTVFETRRNGLARTFMLEHVPAENSTGKCGCSLGGFFYGNSLVVSEFFGFIVLMAVPIMKPG